MSNPDEDTKHDAPDLVDLEPAKTPFEAQVIAGVLREAGLAVYVAGSLLTDEFALSQALMNLQGVAIRVRREDLDRANEVLEQARAAGRQFDEEQSDKEQSEDEQSEGPSDEKA